MRSANFTTARLSVRSWQPVITDKAARRALEASLARILTRPVLQHLPPPLHLDDPEGVSSWVDARAEESELLLIEGKGSRDLVGLMILASDPDFAETPTIHVGYLLAETLWGQGLATELMQGFVSAVKNDGPLRLVGGVDKGNPASARVLQKAGFGLEPERSPPDSDMYVLDID